MATDKKQVKVHVSRAFLFNAADGSEIKFKRGANVVDKEVAEHPFVKAHIVDEESIAEPADAKALAAAIARAEKAEAKVGELELQVAQLLAAQGAGKK
jgi:hypothetical protein